MMLSPWFAPRFVWAAVEGACGLEPSVDGACIAPHIPPDWSWLAARDVPLQGGTLTWVVVRIGERLRIFATRSVESTLDVELFARDVTGEVRVEGEDVALIALADEKRVLVVLGNREPHTVTTAIVREGALRGRTVTRRFDSLRAGWYEDVSQTADALAVRLARGGFALVEFR
jgi:hypothetical protein